jgi:hypothetical protein
MMNLLAFALTFATTPLTFGQSEQADRGPAPGIATCPGFSAIDQVVLPSEWAASRRDGRWRGTMCVSGLGGVVRIAPYRASE